MGCGAVVSEPAPQDGWPRGSWSPAQGCQRGWGEGHRCAHRQHIPLPPCVLQVAPGSCHGPQGMPIPSSSSQLLSGKTGHPVSLPAHPPPTPPGPLPSCACLSPDPTSQETMPPSSTALHPLTRTLQLCASKEGLLRDRSQVFGLKFSYTSAGLF